MRFVYVLPGWKGSTADSRVLRDSINRPNGLKVPIGNYYLCDNGYANSEEFLTPYRGCRYHLKEWGPNTGRPINPHEHFNMRHTRARNVIERAFGVLKKCFGILRSPSFYPIKIQVRLIMACFLLHNFIRSEMPVDPYEQQLVENPVNDNESQPVDIIDTGHRPSLIIGGGASCLYVRYLEKWSSLILCGGLAFNNPLLCTNFRHFRIF